MGPFGKFANKLKGQQKESPKNGKGVMDSRSDSSVEQDQALLNVKLGAGKGMTDDSNRHTDGPRTGDLELKGNSTVSQASRRPDRCLPGKVMKILQDSSTVPSNEVACLNNMHRELVDLTVKGNHKRFDCNPDEARSTVSCLNEGKGSSSQGCDTERIDSVRISKDESAVQESPDLESSSLTLSLGLNRIKTRSGPLYAEEEHQKQLIDKGQSDCETISNARDVEYFQKGAAEKVDLSRSSQAKARRKIKTDSQRLEKYHVGRRYTEQTMMPTISQNFTSTSFCGSNTNEKAPQQHFPAHLSKVSLKSDLLLEKKVPSSLLSYLNHELDEGFEMEVSAKPLDVIKEADSPTFQQPVPVSHHRMHKKWPKDIKSFSHELGPRGGRSHDVQRPHSDNDLEELLAALRARFNTAKEEVDAELKYFAADLIEILDRNTDSFPEWKENVEDLLVLAQRCTKLSPVDFRRECEKIVHELDEHRQELPMGLLKQLHTRMLFILTRCTRLLQFQKESIPEEEGLHKVHQFLKGVPSVALSSVTGKRGKATGTSKKLLSEVLEQSARDAGVAKSKSTRKHRLALEQAKFTDDQPCSPKLLNLRKSPPISSGNIESRDYTKGPTHDDGMLIQVESRWDQNEGKIVDADLQIKQSQKSPWSPWGDSEKEEPESVLCRICEEQVLTSQLQPHSLPCSLADAYDTQGNNIDERLRMLADGLEKIAENTVKNNHLMMDDSPDASRPFKLIAHDGSDNASPLSNDQKTADTRLDDACISESGSVEDLRGVSLINFKRLLGKTDQGVASSSAGSGTPRSTLTTPRTSQLDLLWAERNSFAEQEDVSQIYELASIAREIASKSPTEEDVQFSLTACLDELHEVLSRNKVPALTIETFGRRIEKLLKEKVFLLGGAIDARRSDSLSGFYDDDGMSTDDGVQSLRSTPTHPSCSDRISIEDFYLIKPISRGAFGKVLLAKKRSTGDLFAIKVLRKIDMIRKNAVENILAERDILISVCNPFVVRFFYSFTCRDNLYLVMEYLNGGDLYSLLRHMGCLEEDVARVYIAELVLALEYLHSLGVVHRDLKPDNILIAHDGHIKLTDFGLSKVGLINSTDDLSGPTNGTVMMEESMFENSGESALPRECRKERSAVGTPDYLAPEILLGTEHGYTADWWSVGVILFECITGLPPFNAEHPQIIFDNILNRKIPWPHIPEEMSFDAKDLIDRLLMEDPNQRLGAKGAGEVKSHPFFKDISWENLARQKAAFVPKPESVDDTSYFTTRHLESYANSSPRFGDSSDCETSCSSSNSMKIMLNDGDDDYADISEFQRSPSVERTFNNFSFKNAPQLAYMNYDILSQSGKDSMKGQHSRNQSIS